MKKISQILAATVLVAGLTGFTNVVNAQIVDELENECSTIVITNTGEGSYNEGTCIVNIEVEAVCTNNIYVLNENDQAAVTGAAEEVGSTTGGTSISGDAVNENGTSVSLGTSCGEEETTTAVTTPEEPTKPEAPAAPVAAPAPEVAALPNTASNAIFKTAALGLAVAAAAVVLSRIAIATYRRIAVK